MVAANNNDNIIFLQAGTPSTNTPLMNEFFLHPQTSVVLYACGIVCYDV